MLMDEWLKLFVIRCLILTGLFLSLIWGRLGRLRYISVVLIGIFLFHFGSFVWFVYSAVLIGFMVVINKLVSTKK